MIGSHIEGIRRAGFTIELQQGQLAINPFDRLTGKQLSWLKVHKAEITDHLKAERVTVHVPEFELKSGKRVSFDLSVPRHNLPKLRQSLRFELKDNEGAGSILGRPGDEVEQLRCSLQRKYGPRLATIDGQAVSHAC